MKALVKSRDEVGLWQQEVPKPEAGPGEVLIQINKVAICGTDVHIWKWDEWARNTIPIPMVVGHEYAGVIEQIGDGVTSVSIGQRVSGEGHIPCGRCRNCLSGRSHICATTIGVGVNYPGAFAEYLVIPEANVRPLPDVVSDEIGAILDPLGNAVHTALAFDVSGEDVLISGAGPIGCMAAAVCRHVGAHRIVVTDLSDERLSLAASMGATSTVRVDQQSLSQVMKDLGLREGFDIGLEMSGAESALDGMMKSLITGGKIALLGLYPKAPVVDLNSLIFKGVTIKGIYGREMYDTWHKMLAMLETGLDVSPVISHRLEIDDYEAGFQALLSGEANKVVFNVRD